jgi:hypothetical protein
LITLLQVRRPLAFGVVRFDTATTLGTQIPFFIAAEYYKNSTKANPKHITKVGVLEEGGMGY